MLPSTVVSMALSVIGTSKSFAQPKFQVGQVALPLDCGVTMDHVLDQAEHLFKLISTHFQLQSGLFNHASREISSFRKSTIFDLDPPSRELAQIPESNKAALFPPTKSPIDLQQSLMQKQLSELSSPNVHQPSGSGDNRY